MSFEVPRGSTFGVIGENGSGKSTLLKLMAGITRPTRGAITWTAASPPSSSWGPGFHPEISGRENVAINGIMLGLTRREVAERFDEIVAFAELERFIDAPVKTYSSGMYMRLGFSVAIHVEPDVLLIDEVLAVGDEAFTRKCLDKIGEFRRRGKTIVLVTHSLGLVEKMCDDVLWLRQAKVADRGDPKRVVDAYLTYVAGGEEALLAREHGQGADRRRRGAGGARPRAPAGTARAAGEAARSRSRRCGCSTTAGASATSTSPGERLTIALAIAAREPVSDFVFGVGVFTADGVSVYGTNTHLEDFVAGSAAGAGRGPAAPRRPAAGRGHVPARRGRAPPRRHALRLPPRPVLLPDEEPDQGRRGLPPGASLGVRGRRGHGRPRAAAGAGPPRRGRAGPFAPRRRRAAATVSA